MKRPGSFPRALILALGCTMVPVAMLGERAMRLTSGQEIRISAELLSGPGPDTASRTAHLDLFARPAILADGSNPDRVPHPEGPEGWRVSGWVALVPGPDGIARVSRAQDVRFRPQPGEVLVRTDYSPAPPDPRGGTRFRLALAASSQIELPPGVQVGDGPLVLVLRVSDDGTVQVAGLEQAGQLLVRETIL